MHSTTSEHASIDTAIARISSQRETWAALPVKDRLRLLCEMHDILRLEIDHRAWAEDSLAAMSIPATIQPALVGEMLLNTSIIARDIESLIDTYTSIGQGGSPPQVAIRELPSGQAVADVFPRPWKIADQFGPMADWRVELHMQRDQPPTQGAIAKAPGGKACVVLAAGNQGFLGITDALHQLFIERNTVLLKHHPARAYNHRWCQKLFAPLVSEGFLASCVGGVEEGKHVIAHPAIEHIHMTGGKTTHDIIVWGETENARAQNRAQNTPVIDGTISSELGCVTPWIVVPGDYSDAEIQHQAAHLAFAVVHNNSANCCAPKLLVLAESWPQREAFLGALRGALQQFPHPPPYYPGSRQRYDTLVSTFESDAGFEAIRSAIPGPPDFGQLGAAMPWVMLHIPYEQACVPLESEDAHPLLTQEPFCPILAVCTIPGGGTRGDFLTQAVRLCNESAMGALSATLTIPDALFNDPGINAAISDLRYGAIGVNVWSASCTGFGEGSWGSFPGEQLDAVQSGIGTVGNYLMFDHPEKTVLWTPVVSEAHPGLGPMMDMPAAQMVVDLLTGRTNTARHNEGNGFCYGNFQPVPDEGVYKDLEVKGTIPHELDGMYIRNGVNSRFPIDGKVHMFDGDAMLHCLRLQDGRATSYARQWIKPERFFHNEEAGAELYIPFGDLSTGGMDVARKLGLHAMKTSAGVIPALPENQLANPGVNTLFVGDKFYALTEASAPFQVFVNPDTGEVHSGGWDDLDRHIELFTAHCRICPTTGEVHYFARANLSAYDPHADTVLNTYGVLDREGRPLHRRDVPTQSPGPGFLHDYFLTEHFAIAVDHSLRLDLSKMAVSGAFDFRPDMPLRFGVVPRGGTNKGDIRWFDTGKPGFVWHVAAGWEETRADGGRQLALWLPVFDTYPNTVPIHLAEEPESFLYKAVLDLDTGEVLHFDKAPGMENIAVERCDVNRSRFSQKQRWAYLMKRAEGSAMYDGFVKYDLLEQRVAAVAEYGAGLGGECLFVAGAGPDEDDGWLFDIVHDEAQAHSELLIFSARDLSCVARVQMPDRVPFGVHANWLTPNQLAAQWAQR